LESATSKIIDLEKNKKPITGQTKNARLTDKLKPTTQNRQTDRQKDEHSEKKIQTL
jgi:hypothetical protein